jgi:EmrB/QacA subfamily drug resistance transporter
VSDIVPPPADPAGAPAFPRWRVFPVLALGTVMATLDISVVNIALPTLSRTFRAPLTTIEWVVLAYVLTITALLLPLGRLADDLGRRRMYGAGLALFTGASLACAGAPGAAWLIAARVIQGCGAGMMSSTSLALLTASFPPGERGRAIGAFGAAVGVGLALGPPLGGLVVEHASWRWIFVLNLPAGLLALAMLRGRVPADPPAAGWPRVDVGGAGASSLALVALMLALSRGPAIGWSAPLVLGLFVAAGVLAVAFVAIERRSSHPIVPTGLLRGPLGTTLALTAIGQLLSIAVGVHMPLYLEEVLGLDAGRTGRWMAVLPLTALILAPVAGRATDRTGSRGFTVGGLLVVAAGLTVLGRLGIAPGSGRLLAGLFAVGVGLGLFTVANSSALLGSVPPEHLGLASGLQATSRNLGIAAGSALVIAVVASRYAAHGGAGALAAGAIPPAARSAFALATRDAYGLLAGLAVAGAGLAWTRTTGAAAKD